MAVFDGVIPAIIGAANSAGGASYEIERSLRFNSADTAHLSRDMGTFTDINVGTISFWIKRSALGAGVIAAGWTGSTLYSGSIQFNSTDNALQVGIGGGAAYLFKTNALLRDVSAWYHVVVAWDRSASAADKVKVWINGVAQTSSDTGYQSWTSGDCQIWASNNGNRIGRGDNDRYDNLLNGYLAEYHYVDGQALDESDFGEFDDNNNWNPKQYAGTYGNEGFYLNFSDNSSDAALGTDSSGNNNTWTVNNITAVAFGWPSTTWSDDISIDSGNYYLNGNNGPNGFDGNSATYIDCRLGTGANNTTNIIWEPTGGISDVTKIRVHSQYADDYRINEGTWTSFTSGGSYTQIYNGSAFTLTKLEIRRTSNSGSDYGHRVTAYELNDIEVQDNLVQNSASAIDSLIDTPLGYTADSGNNGGNYATLNALDVNSSLTLSNGNLEFQAPAGSGWKSVRGTIGVSSGKWYWEYKALSNVGSAVFVGISKNTSSLSLHVGQDADGYGLYRLNGNIYNNNSSSSYTTAFGLNTIVGVALDLDAGTLVYYYDGVSQGTAVTGLSGEWLPAFSAQSDGNGILNFGQRPFAYTPPTGYVSLCTQNFADPTIADGSDYFDTKLWTGNGSTQSITGFEFSPDFVWIHSRNFSGDHALFDAVRGATKRIRSNQTNAENTDANTLTAFNSDGFSIGSSSAVNNNTKTFVGWAWDAGTSNSTITAGSLNSSFYDQSAVWSDMCSPAPSINSYVNGFDGSLTTTFAGGISPGSYFTFTPTGGGITFTDKVRVYNGAVSGASYKYNNGSAQTFTANAWNTVATGGGTMTSFGVTRSGTDVHGWYAIEVDGKILVDQGLTPALNVPAVDSTCRTNQTAGFSIVSYTGNSVAGSRIGHNLNAQPSLIILKNRDRSINWAVGHLAANTFVDGDLNLNTTNDKGTGYIGFFGANPTSSVFTINNNYESNYANEDYIAYCFAPVEGYSAFGSYTGLGGTEGPFVYTGFKPAWLMVKASSSSGGSWVIYDNTRGSYNLNNAKLAANLSGEENNSTLGGTSLGMDFLSNGFKYRGDGGVNHNSSGVTYIYAAFAEHPFKTARAR